MLSALLLLLPLAGLVPAHRDLPGYFLPMRQWTASELASGRIPWLNPLNGCGESWYANPQTGVLYPPAWIWLALPARWALTLEIALHLAWLSLGAGLLAWSWTGRRDVMLTAQLTALAAPPVLALAGMLNNLETLAWLPWMVLAARGSPRVRVLLLPLAVAGGWLAAEPVLWAFGLAAAVAVAPRDRWTLAGVSLGVLLAGVQLLPFAGWVLQGDRGAGVPPEPMLAGALPLRGLGSFLVPGAPGSGWIETLFLGGPLLAAGIAFLWRRPPALGAPVLLLGLAVSPAVHHGGFYLALTAGLVRYPSRFAAMAAVILAAAGVAGLRDWLRGGEQAASAAMGVLTLAACAAAPPAGRAAGGVLAALLLAAATWPSKRAIRVTALGASLCAALPLLYQVLEPRSYGHLDRMRTPWAEARGAGRMFSPVPGPDSRRRLAAEPVLRAAWPVGYTNLLAGLARVRTDAPLEHRALAALDRRATSPRRMWWLNSSGARWVVLSRRTRAGGLRPVRSERGLWLHRNPGAWPQVLLTSSPPAVERAPGVVPGLLTLVRRPDGLVVRTRCDQPSWAVISLTPVRGWRFQVDGAAAVVEPGPSVLQRIQIPPGSHHLEGRFRPGLLGMGAAGSSMALVMMTTLALVRRHREGSR
jgi:hypothetical protein